MFKRWKLKEVDDAKVVALHSALKINPILCRILVARGIQHFEQAKAYFRPEIAVLHDPWLMKDMDKAVERIVKAIRMREKILVFGDYDVDGTTGVACMYMMLCRICNPSLVDFYVPHRHREGYGISKAGIDYARENGFGLIISIDCGIKSVDLVAYAALAGIDFIICDHHLPDMQLPAAVAILNPKQAGCPYPYKDLCGCGVAFKLITALAQTHGMKESDVYFLLDLVAIAIAADIVPMTGENRVLAFHGLKKLNKDPNSGIRALMKLSGLRAPASITSLVFMIAPRVNAAGRMDDARKAVQMFISDNFEEALSLAGLLHSDNADRKEADLVITEEAIALIEGDEVMRNRKSTVVFRSHWHKGVVGIVASRLIEKYYRPTVVLTQTDQLVSGSARSVQGFNLYEAIHGCREFLIGYGGHFAAAGMTLAPEHVDHFSKKFEEIVSATIEPSCLIPELNLDAEIQFCDISSSFFNIVQQMEPFGPENTNPVFVSRQVSNTGYSRLLKDKHIRFSLRQSDTVISGIGFNMADKFELLSHPVDIVFTLDEHEWNGGKSLQLKVIDLRVSERN
ncbi:MAG: single-stranded-DNA-specific exonuclease RecJ [Bacteroidota bacterium]|nr:single-stranded-DNA-specific exonuclease RecJ [Bacteroidota bacterium]MDP4251727.1 single-stranded-DNA-specific exonuclease RecJ [Bacteroidota bacterium]